MNLTMVAGADVDWVNNWRATELWFAVEGVDVEDEEDAIAIMNEKMRE